jgi:formylglycine-generating enzyme required for sulfatase activity
METAFGPEVQVQRDPFGQEFCYVPNISFAFGIHQRPVQIRAPYLIGRFPITRAQFLHFLRETGYDYGEQYLFLMDRFAPYPNCPATPISWWDAKQYVRWLRQITGEYYSLPSEWEWEAAARGSDGRAYPWGNEGPTPAQAVFSDDEPRLVTGLVNGATNGESPYGCWDMVGNVWEWCLDPCDAEDQTHILRGGSAADSVDSATCTARRYSFLKSKRIHFAGFRLLYLPGELFEHYCHAMEANREADETVVNGVVRQISTAPGLF